MLGRRLLVLGGTSEIALAIVEALVAEGVREVALAGRSPAALAGAAERVRRDGAESVSCVALDLGDPAALVRDARHALGEIDLVLHAVGMLGAGTPEDAAEVLAVTGSGACTALVACAEALREQGHGVLIVLSSAAAARPRRSNPAYGAAKAMLDALALALDDALREQGVRMLVVRPGFVRTRMTAGLRPAPLACDPPAVAGAVLDALRRGRRVVWVPRAMGAVMLALRLTPASIFRRLPL